MHLIKVRYKNGGSFYLENAAFEIFRQQKRQDSGLVPEFDTSHLAKLYASRDEASLSRQSLNIYMKRLKSDDQMPYALARHYAITGESKKALDCLAAAFGSRKPGLVVFIGVDPLWDPLREEPRFQELLTKMGLF